MQRRTQNVILLIWVGSPFILLAALLLINPVYASRIFESLGPLSGMTCVVVLQTLNLLALLLTFNRLHHQAKQKPEGGKGHRPLLRGLVLAATLCALTFPSLWFVLFYPSLMILLKANSGF
jgi:hypothetical protein